MPYTAGGESHSLTVPLVRVQHAQLDGQLPVVVSDDGEGQSAFAATESHHILYTGQKNTYNSVTVNVFIVLWLNILYIQAYQVWQY